MFRAAGYVSGLRLCIVERIETMAKRIYIEDDELMTLVIDVDDGKLVRIWQGEEYILVDKRMLQILIEKLSELLKVLT